MSVVNVMKKLNIWINERVPRERDKRASIESGKNLNDYLGKSWKQGELIANVEIR